MIKRLRAFALVLCDVLSMGFVLLSVAWAYRLIHGGYEMSAYLKLWPACLIFVMVNEVAKLYQGSLLHPGVTFGPPEELRRLFYSVSCVFLFVLAFLFMAKSGESYSRFVIFASWGVCLLAVPLSRWALRSVLKRWRFGEIPAIVIGAGLAGEKAAHLFNKSKYLGLRPMAFLDDDPSKHGKLVNGVEVKGPVSMAEELRLAIGAEYVIICLPPQFVRPVLEGPCNGFSQALVIPDKAVFSSMWTYIYDIGGMLGLEIRRTLLLKHLRVIKGMVDLGLSLLSLLFLSPLLLLIAVAVKLASKGPVLYKAKRLGQDGKEFEIFKFRTMRIDADEALERLLEENPEMKKEWNKSFKLKVDPRVTPLGRFLRKSSLDELPQLLNVLRGEMSLIGPRPIVKGELPYFGSRSDVIFKVKPGITGLWQVSGRTDTSYAERVDLDVYYIMNWNIWLDVYILLKTVKEVLFCRGAY